MQYAIFNKTRDSAENNVTDVFLHHYRLQPSPYFYPHAVRVGLREVGHRLQSLGP